MDPMTVQIASWAIENGAAGVLGVVCGGLLYVLRRIVARLDEDVRAVRDELRSSLVEARAELARVRAEGIEQERACAERVVDLTRRLALLEGRDA